MLNSLELLGFKLVENIANNVGDLQPLWCNGRWQAIEMRERTIRTDQVTLPRTTSLTFQESRHRITSWRHCLIRIKCHQPCTLTRQAHTYTLNRKERKTNETLQVQGGITDHANGAGYASAESRPRTSEESIRDMIVDNASDVGEDDIGRLLFANIICENSTDTTESD